MKTVNITLTREELLEVRMAFSSRLRYLEEEFGKDRDSYKSAFEVYRKLTRY